MRADSPFLLVIDPKPEGAARVSTLLRRAGLSVNVLHADNGGEAERLNREFAPFLIYYLPDSRECFPVDEAARLAEAGGTPLGLGPGGGGEAPIHPPAGQGDCITLGDEAELPALARRLAGLDQGAEVGNGHGKAPAQDPTRLGGGPREAPTAYFHEGLHVAANRAYLDLLGADRFEDVAPLSLLEMLDRDDVDLKALIRAFGRGEFPFSGERFGLRAPGRDPVDAHLVFTPVRYQGENCVKMTVGEDGAAETPVATTTAAPAPHAQTAQVEPSEAANAPESLDPLTGMLLRAAFLERLNRHLARRPEDRLAAVYYLTNDDAERQLDELAVADMDDYVRATADEVLSCLEDGDEVCRVSDSSYAIFALRAEKSSLKDLGDKLRAAIERRGMDDAAGPAPRTCSVGILLLDNQLHEAEPSLEKARAACRLAAAGGNAVQRYKPARMAGVSEDEEAHWRERLRYALDNEDFFTIQHSIMNLDGTPEGLVENRTFMHDEEEDLSADQFLPPAERNRLASQIDRLVIPSLLLAVGGGEERQVIEISGNSLQDFSFPTWFQRTLQESRFPGQRVVLQWPAWAARQQIKAARRLIEELSPLGVRFSVSGFDADPKTLELLRELKLQYVTLERDMTTELQGDSIRLDVIGGVIRAAEEVQVSAIANAVSTPDDLAMLWRAGVKLVSGDFVQETPRVIGQ